MLIGHLPDRRADIAIRVCLRSKRILDKHPGNSTTEKNLAVEMDVLRRGLNMIAANDNDFDVDVIVSELRGIASAMEAFQ